MEEAVQVKHVWMLFNLSRKKEERIKEYVIDLLKGQLFFDRFWALRDISFTLEKGESFGIVGLNGSGKSTLLKTIAGILEPTSGSVAVQGVVAPLIELGGGFDPELTARENIFLTGSMHGLGRGLIREKYPSVIEFAELCGFEDVPVKNFSSGMRSRLGFAIATAIEPDVLIVDEVLSVGDARFREKCERRIQEIIGRGATVLFVSHSAGQVERICGRALWLDHGEMRLIGPAQEVCAAYQDFCKGKG